MSRRSTAIIILVALSSLIACQYNGSTTTDSDYEYHPPTWLKYKLIEYFGEVGERGGIHYCDPLLSPDVSREKTLERAYEEMGEIEFDEDEYRTILSYLDLFGREMLTDQDVLDIYTEHHKLMAIRMEFGESNYLFSLPKYDPGQRNSGYIISGSINSDGKITITSEVLANFGCP